MIFGGFRKRNIFVVLVLLLLLLLAQLTFYGIYIVSEKQFRTRVDREKRLLDTLKRITSVTNSKFNQTESDQIMFERQRKRKTAIRISSDKTNIAKGKGKSKKLIKVYGKNSKNTNKNVTKICNLTQNKTIEESVFQQHPIMEIKLRFPLNEKRLKIIRKLKVAMKDLKDLLYDNGEVEQNSLNELNLRVPLVYEPHPWFLLEDKMARLSENPIYQRFNITSRKVKPRVNLLLIVNSAPRRSDRRFSIRLTWWNLCRSTIRISVKCLFMTDKKDPNTTLGLQLKNEQQIFQDLEFQPIRGGFESGNRLLYHMIWAVEKYDFDYFLRLDDDYFLCLDRLLLEIPMPPRISYHWGYLHCYPNMVRPDESILLLSNDLVKTFLGQDPNIMMCLPVGDEMIGHWKAVLKLGPIYNAESRLYHHPPAALNDTLVTLKNVCQLYIGIHGSYPKEMNQFWKNRGKSTYPNNTLEKYYKECSYEEDMDWQMLPDEWNFEPKRCILNPSWNQLQTGRFLNKHGEFGGREEEFKAKLWAKRLKIRAKKKVIKRRKENVRELKRPRNHMNSG